MKRWITYETNNAELRPGDAWVPQRRCTNWWQEFGVLPRAHSAAGILYSKLRWGAVRPAGVAVRL